MIEKEMEQKNIENQLEALKRIKFFPVDNTTYVNVDEIVSFRLVNTEVVSVSTREKTFLILNADFARLAYQVLNAQNVIAVPILSDDVKQLHESTGDAPVPEENFTEPRHTKKKIFDPSKLV